jgi:hypothetical protein
MLGVRTGLNEHRNLAYMFGSLKLDTVKCGKSSRGTQTGEILRCQDPAIPDN